MNQSIQPKRQSVQPHSARHCRDMTSSSPVVPPPVIRTSLNANNASAPAPRPALLARVPVSYAVFNLPYLDDTPSALPHLERRRLLAEPRGADPRLPMMSGHNPGTSKDS